MFWEDRVFDWAVAFDAIVQRFISISMKSFRIG
jgi:hypothetical protein